MRGRAKILIAAAGALVCILIFAATAGAAKAKDPDPFDFGNPSFCDPAEPAFDFGLSSLPPVHELSEEEAGKELGDPAVSVYGGWSHVMSKPEEFGYGFSEDDYNGPVHVDWTVTAQLWSVDAEGRAIEEVGHTGLFLKTIDAAHQPHIGLTPPDRRGFYRFDLRFESHGTTIGSYSSYLKLVRPSWRARLKLSRTVVHPGERILSRLESLGSEGIDYGEDFMVQRKIDGVWARAPELAKGPWASWLGILLPGGIGRCSALWMPTDVSPGRYRIVKEINHVDWPHDKRRARLRAPFEVAAP